MSPALLLAIGLIQVPLPPTKVIVPPPPPVAGVVVNERGQPVAGAELFRIGILPNGASMPTILWRGKTDGQGRFTIERANGVTEGPWPGLDLEFVIAAHPGHRPAQQRLPSWSDPAARPELKIELRPPADAPIRVLGPDDAPVVGARVHFLGPGGLSLPTIVDESFAATTDMDGRARLPLLDPTGSRRCLITTPQFGKQAVTYDGRDQEEKVFTLRATGRVSGRVIADDPAAVRHVRVSGSTHVRDRNGQMVFDDEGSFATTTDTDGRFEVPALASGEVFVSLRPPQRYVVVGNPAETTLEIGKRAEVEWTLKRGIAARGVLRERGSGRPIVHAVVRVHQRGENLLGTYRSCARTDDDGRFEFFLHPGPIELSLLYAGPYVLVDGPTQQLGTIPEGVESYELPPAELARAVDLRVLVRDPDGKPVTGATVEAVLADGQRVPGPFSSRERLTNAQGELTLWPLPPDRKVELCASLGDAASGRPVPVLPDALQPATLVVSIENTMSLGGRVVDQFGKPVSGAYVSIRSRRRTSSGVDVYRRPGGLFAGTGWDLHTDDEGHFQTPRQLRRFEDHHVYVRTDDGARVTTDWFAPTTPSFFDITLNRPTTPEAAFFQQHADSGWDAYNQGDYANAESSFQTALDDARKRGFDEPVALASWLTGLAEAQRCLGKIDSAETVARRALALREQALNPTNPNIAEAHCVLGSILQSRRKPADAEAQFRKALDIQQRAAGSISPGYAHALALLGSLELTLDRNKEAEADLARAVSIVEKVRGHDSSDLLWALENHGLALWKLHRLPEAETVFRRTLALTEKIYGPDHAEVARIRKDLAQLVRARGKPAETGSGQAGVKRDR